MPGRDDRTKWEEDHPHPDPLPRREREDEDDPEAPQESDLNEYGGADEADEETPTVPCARCGKEIPDFADRCPYCGEWVVQGGESSRKSIWVFVVVVLLLLAWVWWMF